MPQPTRSILSTCAHCIGKRRLIPKPSPHVYNSRALSTTARLTQSAGSQSQTKANSNQNGEEDEQQGAMSRRLAAMSEDALETGGKRAQKAVQEAGFDEALRRRLEERIASANFRSDNAAALAEAELPATAPRHTRDIASTAPWAGTESVGDASLRMLNDSIKPMRRTRTSVPFRGPPAKIDTGRSRVKVSSGARMANARDKTSTYEHMKDMPADQREQFRKEMKERFTPAARSIPMTIKGLESLANERIEDAISRGQFKNLPRGKVLERDYSASSPFINTTEYLLNKMIQRQDIVPPWIEKQQELVSTAARFRGRLRSDWRRHVARTISSRGGSLESQIHLAEEYARAEALENPLPKKTEEKLNSVDEDGHLSQITVAGELKAVDTNTTSTAGTEQQITITEQSLDSQGHLAASEAELQAVVDVPLPPPAVKPPTVRPFRDAKWLSVEQSYHKLAVEDLNTNTRSYNLMCPAMAQRPYFSLDRELKACYADVAPQIAKEIMDRARAPKHTVQTYGHKPASVLEKFAGHQARVYDEQRPRFGFRELVKEWFGKKT